MARAASRGSSQGPSQRQLRVGELVRRAVSDFLGRGAIHDDVLAEHVITVPEVRMSPDLKIATVYVMPLGGDEAAADQLVKALAGHRRLIRGEVSRNVDLKFAPDLRFKKDRSFDEAMRIEQLLDSPKVRQDLDSGDR